MKLFFFTMSATGYLTLKFHVTNVKVYFHILVKLLE